MLGPKPTSSISHESNSPADTLISIVVVFPPGKVGIGISSEGVVDNILCDSPAEQNGIREGWTITHLNRNRYKPRRAFLMDERKYETRITFAFSVGGVDEFLIQPSRQDAERVWKVFRRVKQPNVSYSASSTTSRAVQGGLDDGDSGDEDWQIRRTKNPYAYEHSPTQQLTDCQLLCEYCGTVNEFDSPQDQYASYAALQDTGEGHLCCSCEQQLQPVVRPLIYTRLCPSFLDSETYGNE